LFSCTRKDYYKGGEKGSYRMKRAFLLFLFISLFITIHLSAQQLTEIKLRFSTQVGLTRIVLEGNEACIQNTKVNPQASQIKVEFPEPIKLNPQKNPPFGISLKDNILILQVREESAVKFFRLSSPPRLVLDIQDKTIVSERQPSTIIANKFVIDAGHGGYDFGITSGKKSEKEVNLTLVRNLGKALLSKRKKVFYTRKVDQYVPIVDRIRIVNKNRPDIFISFHTSMSEHFVIYSPKFENQVQDSQTVAEYYSISSRQRKYIGKSKALADSIESAIEGEFQIDAVRRNMHLPILNSAGAPCVFIEFPSPKFLIYDKQMEERINKAMLGGIADYGLKQIQMDITH
jgi:N-acetylmuramoyl-L-alanine amidase